MKHSVKLGAKLGLYSVASCVLLAVVNNFTSPVILERALQKEKEGLRIVFPLAENFEPISADEINLAVSMSKVELGSIKIETMYKALDNSNETKGFVAKLSGPTYDTSSLLVGINLDQSISGVHILSTSDSPGYGQKAADPKYLTSKGVTFTAQFTGVKPLDSFERDTDYEIISGATMTSNGVTSMIKNGAKVIKAYSDLHNANLLNQN